MTTLRLPSFTNHPETATALVTAFDLNFLLEQGQITNEGAKFLCPQSSVGLLKLTNRPLIHPEPRLKQVIRHLTGILTNGIRQLSTSFKGPDKALAFLANIFTLTISPLRQAKVSQK